MDEQQLRLLDRQVADAIGDVWVPDNPDRPDGDGWWLSKDGNKISCADGGPARYSSDWSAMGRLYNMILEQEYVALHLQSSHYNGDYCSVSAPYPSQQDEKSLVKNDTRHVWGETLPIALCKAFLESVK